MVLGANPNFRVWYDGYPSADVKPLVGPLILRPS
jgi:hypothetical protein